MKAVACYVYGWYSAVENLFFKFLIVPDIDNKHVAHFVLLKFSRKVMKVLDFKFSIFRKSRIRHISPKFCRTWSVISGH